VLNNEVLDSKRDLVSSDSLEQDHLLEGVQILIPLSRHWFIVRLIRIIDLFKLLNVLDEILDNTLEGRKLGHTKDLFVALSPFKISKERSRVFLNLDLTGRTSQEVSHFISIHSLVTKQDLDTQHEREEKLVLLEKTSANIFVEQVSEEVVQVLDSSSLNIGFRRILNGIRE